MKIIGEINPIILIRFSGNLTCTAGCDFSWYYLFGITAGNTDLILCFTHIFIYFINEIGY